jgi:hypothetical protein
MPLRGYGLTAALAKPDFYAPYCRNIIYDRLVGFAFFSVIGYIVTDNRPNVYFLERALFSYAER